MLFVYPTQLSRVSHSIDTCTLAIRYIRNMHAVSTNQIADILHFNNNATYKSDSVGAIYNSKGVIGTGNNPPHK